MAEALRKKLPKDHPLPLSRLLAPWSIRKFLVTGGSVLVFVGVAGVTGLLGTFSKAEAFHPPRWINWFHLSAGTAVLSVAMFGGKPARKILALFGATMGGILGVGGIVFTFYETFRGGTGQVADYSDPIVHLAVSLFGSLALLNERDKRRIGT
jgi:hypothetical protein